jgi:riboflavin synthase
MFTGIVEESGIITGVRPEKNGKRISCMAEKVLEDTKVGDSIAIDGVCQTVEVIEENIFSFFVSQVSESITTLGSIKKGVRVNLERALRLSDRLGGHIMQGHVDCTGVVTSVSSIENAFEIYIQVSHGDYKYVVEKGSIGVNGVSLTVVKREDSYFTVYLIPESMRLTNLINLKMGDEVNLEFDVLAKYVNQLINKDEKKDILNLLRESGY